MSGGTIDEKLDKAIKNAKTKDQAFALIVDGSKGALGMGNDETAAKKHALEIASDLKLASTPPILGTCSWDKENSQYKFETDKASPKLITVIKGAMERDLGKKVAFVVQPPLPPQKGGTQNKDGNTNGGTTTPQKQPVVSKEMQRKIDLEMQQYLKRNYPERSVWQGKIDMVPKMPKENQDKGYEVVSKQLAETKQKLTSEKEIDENFRSTQLQALNELDNFVAQARELLKKDIKGQDQGSGVSKEMQRKIDLEMQKYLKQNYPERSVWQSKIDMVPKMPKENQDKGYEIVAKQIGETVQKLNSEDEIDPNFRSSQLKTLMELDQSITQARNLLKGVQSLKSDEKGKDKIDEKGKDKVDDKNKGKIDDNQRAEAVKKRLEKLKPLMQQAEQVRQAPETSKLLGEFGQGKTNVLVGLQKQNLDLAEKSMATLEQVTPKLLNAWSITVNQIERQKETDKSLKGLKNTVSLNVDPSQEFNKELTKQIDKATDRGALKGGHGTVFKPVIKALETVDKDPSDPNLTTLENAAKSYLADYERRVKEAQSKGKDKDLKELQTDKVTQAKVTACNDAIEKVRKLRVRAKLQQELSQLPTTGLWTEEQQAQGTRIKAQLIAESGGGKPLGDQDDKGASESYFLTDPTSGEKAFIFKPSDGEFDAGYGWDKGGGAPREVALSKVNDVLKKSTGLDCGVSSTTLVKINNPSVGTNKNGGGERVGAIQNFVKSDKALSNKLDPNKVGEYDKNFINTIPPEEIEKVAILDFATLQMDRQAANLLVSSDQQGKPRLTPIDAGNALPGRKAFEASRRMFTNNALLSGDEAKKKFSPEALEKINAINEDEVVEGMKKANEEMAKLDPKAGQAIGKENMEMTRRSIRFLKAAAKDLTKAEIADAYANLFSKVLDAAPDDVDAMIEQVIKQQLAKPNVINKIDTFPNNKTVFIDLGWPNDEFNSMRSENPERLLKILQDGRECPATVARISQLIKEIGTPNIGFDPTSIPSLTKRLSDLENRKEEIDNNALINDPQVAKTFEKAKWDFVGEGDKPGTTANLTVARTKAERLRQMQDYLASGGDEALKKKGFDPKKMSTLERIYQGLGGDEALADLERKGYNPYMGKKLEIRISDLQAAKEFEKLGGEQKYSELGCPQNKEASLPVRITLMKQKMLLVNGDVGGATAALESLDSVLESIMAAKEKCTKAEYLIQSKAPRYRQIAADAEKPRDQQAQTELLKEITSADMEISNIMKQFGRWNRDVISPWKTVQGTIKNENLESDKRVKKLNREVTQAYDVYAAALSSAQDLGQDFLDLIKRVEKRVKAGQISPDDVLADVQKLALQMTDPTFGACSKLANQSTEIDQVSKLATGAKGKTGAYGEKQWDTVAEWDTKVRQSFEVAKANYRAMLRGKEHLSDFVKAAKGNQKVQQAALPVAQAIAKGEKTYGELDKLVPVVLKEISDLEALKPQV